MHCLVRGSCRARTRLEPIPIVYRLALEGDDWKVVDVSVGGVWLVPAYRSQFAQVLRSGEVDALINVLHEKSEVR